MRTWKINIHESSNEVSPIKSLRFGKGAISVWRKHWKLIFMKVKCGRSNHIPELITVSHSLCYQWEMVQYLCISLVIARQRENKTFSYEKNSQRRMPLRIKLKKKREKLDETGCFVWRQHVTLTPSYQHTGCTGKMVSRNKKMRLE